MVYVHVGAILIMTCLFGSACAHVNLRDAEPHEVVQGGVCVCNDVRHSNAMWSAEVLTSTCVMPHQVRWCTLVHDFATLCATAVQRKVLRYFSERERALLRSARTRGALHMRG